jgi:hypothetical protein
MHRLQAAERATLAVEAPQNSILPIMRRVLRVESLCMPMPRLKGADVSIPNLDHSWIVDERMSSL